MGLQVDGLTLFLARAKQTMKRAYSAGTDFLDLKPKALPWAGMNDAVGV
jgi:hypothetical protein